MVRAWGLLVLPETCEQETGTRTETKTNETEETESRMSELPQG